MTRRLAPATTASSVMVWIVMIGLVGLAVIWLRGVHSAAGRDPVPSVPGTTAPVGPAPVVSGTTSAGARPLAATALTDLVQRRSSQVAGYQRTAFGEPWADVDGNGCSTREDVLRRDLRKVALRSNSRCLVASGTLVDPYSGKTMSFTRGPETSPLVQIDHVVSLADAWDSGASKWSASQRQVFANDPLNLLAVDGQLNFAKADSTAVGWLPPLVTARCGYVARQISVKVKYRLSVTAPEAVAMDTVLRGCPGQSLAAG